LSIEQENRRDHLSLIWTRCCIQSAFAHPIDVVRDADLTLNEKRAILASKRIDAPYRSGPPNHGSKSKIPKRRRQPALWTARSDYLPGQSPAVSANSLLINACDFLRDVTAVAACHRFLRDVTAVAACPRFLRDVTAVACDRPNRCNRLRFANRLHPFRPHASCLGLGSSQSTAGNAHQTKRYDALCVQRQHGCLRG
jgi:hypothetical protein